jgi:asparagine synthase (glutamine-hydrolysing)
MCGLVAIFGEPEAVPLPRRMAALDSIAHRGPDAEAVWSAPHSWMGFRRLSIIDLSDGANQPMVDPETGLVIVFNGEIYNYVELREELRAKGHRFRTSSDTEVLLKAYAAWGPEALNKLNGMWALAIWDPKTKLAFLARDRFGVKPLYYSIGSSGLMLASEPKALHWLDPRSLDVDRSTLVDFFVRSQSHCGERTFYSRIKALPAGYSGFYAVDERTLTLRRYWDYPHPEDGSRASADDQAEFTALFDDAVKIRLRTDVPLGLTLSGGLDSSAILASATQLMAGPMRSYTSVYGANQRAEESWAMIAATCAGTEAFAVEAPLDSWANTLPAIASHMDSPGFSPAVLPLWHIMARARGDGVPVLLEGQGADEYLAGYTQHAAAALLGQLGTGDLSRAPKAFFGMCSAFGSKWALSWLARSLLPAPVTSFLRHSRAGWFEESDIVAWRARSVDPTVSNAGEFYDPLYKALWLDHSRQVLPSLLHYGDAISMAHGIESRLPFMDYRLVEWVFRTRPNLIEHGHTKSPVRRYLKDRGFDRISARKDKIGYSVPVSAWLSTSGREYVHDTLADPGADIWSYLRHDKFQKLLAGTERNNNSGTFHFFKLVSTQAWLQALRGRSDALRVLPSGYRGGDRVGDVIPVA